MPAVEALRGAYPGARITLLTLPYTASLARTYAEVDEVVSVDTNRIRTISGLLSLHTWLEYWRVFRQLRGRQIDLCLSAHGRMASLWAFLSGSRRSFGYAREAYPFVLSDRIPGGRYEERMHEVEYVRRLADYVGVVGAPQRLSVPVPDSAREAVAARLAAHGVAVADSIVVIHAGSVHPAAKRWPAARWSRFADEVQKRTGARPILIGSQSDEPVVREVLRRASMPIVSLVGQTTVEELVALIARADLLASGDSGPLHLAVALERPVVAVYGPTDPFIYGPYRPRAAAHVHRRDLPCSPCYPYSGMPECPLGDPICMRLVSVEEMVESALELLEGSSPAR